jgi:hypothetical protein
MMFPLVYHFFIFSIFSFLVLFRFVFPIVGVLAQLGNSGFLLLGSLPPGIQDPQALAHLAGLNFYLSLYEQDPEMMDPFIFPPSMDGMLIECPYSPSSSYPNSVNGPAFSGESVNSNYMELEAAPNEHPNPNPNQSNIPYFAANANFYQYQWNLFSQYQYQWNLFSYLTYYHYLMGLPFFPSDAIAWVPVPAPYFALFYFASIYPMGGEGAALVPPSTPPGYDTL